MSWKDDALDKIKLRNAIQTIPFIDIYRDYTSILNEVNNLSSILIDVERKGVEIQCDLHVHSKTNQFIEITSVQQRIRNLLDVLRNKKYEKNYVEENFSHFRRRSNELEINVKHLNEELNYTKNELSVCYEKLAAYEYDVSRIKSDMEIVCIENASLRESLKDNTNIKIN